MHNIDKWRASYQSTMAKKRADAKLRPFEEQPGYLQREQVFEQQNGCCAKCGLDKWLGNLIPLELEHKDGNHLNNARSNVELLCPNCHAMTDTWRGRNKKVGAKNVSDAEMQEALKTSKNIRQALIKLGLAPKGNNYQRAKRLLEIP
jgi:5-methylcytosine-specific restriction endonuclease McrA